MANNIGVRSPHFVSFGATDAVFFRLNITINGGEKYYTLEKTGGVTVGSSKQQSFEVSELIRDYIDISYDGTMPSDVQLIDYATGNCVNVSFGWEAFDEVNPDPGTSPVNVGGVSMVAYDAYKFFDETGISFTYPTSAVLLTSKTVCLPESTDGTFYYTDGTIFYKYDISTSQEGDITLVGQTVTIKRQDCSRYNPVKLVFVNRFGMLQELWFFGRTTESSSVESEDYKSANIAYNGAYNRFEHQFKKFDVFAKKKYIINSGFVGEYYNDSISELLMSEQVWMHIDGTVRPINVTSSDVTYKTSLNDRMVEYTLEVEQANDLISTMR